MRSLPKPNTNDDVSNRLAHGTTQNHNAKEVAVSDGLKFKERQILAVQDGFNKAAFGFYGSANKFGLKVAQSGYDVLTTSNDNLIFNSEQNVLKVIYSGYTTITHSVGILGTGSFGVNPQAYTVNDFAVPTLLAYVAEPLSARQGTQVFRPGQPLPIGLYYPLEYSELSMSVAGAITSHLEVSASVSENQTIFFLRAQNLTSGNVWVDTAYTLYIKYWLFEESITTTS